MKRKALAYSSCYDHAIRCPVHKTYECASLTANDCRCIGGAEVQQNLLVRLQNLSQLEALLAHVLALLPSSPCLQVIAGPHTAAQAQTKTQVRTRVGEVYSMCEFLVFSQCSFPMLGFMP